jgi:hypothetical protein
VNERLINMRVINTKTNIVTRAPLTGFVGHADKSLPALPVNSTHFSFTIRTTLLVREYLFG